MGKTLEDRLKRCCLVKGQITVSIAHNWTVGGARGSEGTLPSFSVVKEMVGELHYKILLI